jgi:hypothetical protein
LAFETGEHGLLIEYGPAAFQKEPQRRNGVVAGGAKVGDETSALNRQLEGVLGQSSSSSRSS